MHRTDNPSRGVKLSFVEYQKAGVPITILTVLIGIVWLSVVKYKVARLVRF